MKVSMSNIYEFRKILVSELENVPQGKTIKIIDTGYNQLFLQNILFDFNNKTNYKEFAFSLFNILYKIDYTGIDFSNFCCDNFDFTNLRGVKINPQTICNKELANVKCCNVEFSDTFDNSVNIKGVDFTGSNYLELTSLTQNFRNKIKILILK